MTIKIVSRLTKTEHQRIRRVVTRMTERDSGLVIHVGPARYDLTPEAAEAGVGVHDAARSLMIIAGRTFEYEVLS